jgi:orotate phosphoribosyltransferase
LTLGADPVAYAISHTSATHPRPLRAFTVRKEPKKHGTGKRIEGPFHRGDRIVVIEDVITTGQSALQAIEIIEAEGGEVLGVLAVVDRDEGGSDTIRQMGYPVVSLVTRSQLNAVSNSSGAV